MAARDSREKKILKTRDLKQRKKYLKEKLSRILFYESANPKMRVKRDKLLTRAIHEKKLSFLEFRSRFPEITRESYSTPILPVPGRIV